MTYRQFNDEVPHSATLIREPSIVEEFIFVFASIRSSRVSVSTFRLSVLAAAFSAALAPVPQASAQTSIAPQLLPYTAKLIAGQGTAVTAGAACKPGTTEANQTPSGYVSMDAYGDGCLATEIKLTNPKQAVTDANGVVYFIDYASSTTGVVHRIDPATGIVTLVAGGIATNPASGQTCSATDPHTVTTAVADLYGDGCLATSVKLEEPYGLAFAPNGDLYVDDYYAYNVRKVSMSNGGISGVAITNGGASYATAPTVTFSLPSAGGTKATGTAVINGSGVVTGVTMTNNGSGYSAANPPTVTFSVPGTGTNTATGIAAYTGVISMAVGNNNGTNTTFGYSGLGTTPSAAAANACDTTATTGTLCSADSPSGLAFDTAGNLYIGQYYPEFMVLNTNTTGSTTVMGQTLPALHVMELLGTCVVSPANCTFGAAAGSTIGTSTPLDNNLGVALDSYGNVYTNDAYYGSVLEVTGPNSGSPVLPTGGSQGYLNGLLQSSVPTVDYVNYYAGTNPGVHATNTVAANKRGIAATFNIGYNNSVGTDPTNNLYTTDYTNAYVWRVDAATQTMYVVGGGGAAIATGAACASGSPLTATDALGDGCPATLVKLSTTVFGVKSDPNSNIYIGDTGNAAIREITTGTNFGNTGATQTNYLDIHFQAGDTPAATKPFTITTGAANFTVGTPVCTTNTDTNATFGNSTDCVVPITANPITPGAYSGVLTVASKNVPATTFPLNGTFVQSPVTKTSVSVAGSASCSTSATSFPSNAAVTLQAALTANGPSAPTGTIIFYANNVALAPTTGVAVSNIGTSSAPVYGATLSYTFSTPNSYAVTAQYVPTAGSYFAGSTSAADSITSSTPTLVPSLSTGQQAIVTAGGTALYNFTLASSNFTGSVSFACTGLPAGASCVFDPPSLTIAGCGETDTIALSITTQAPVISAPAGFGGTGNGPWSMIAVCIGVLMASLIGLFRRRLSLRSGHLLLLAAFLLAATGLTACSGKPAGAVLSPGTPAFNGNINVAITGSDGTASSFTVPLTIH